MNTTNFDSKRLITATIKLLDEVEKLLTEVNSTLRHESKAA